MRTYDRSELIADAAIHAAGILGGVIGSTTLILLAPTSTPILIYSAALVAVLVTSAAYNLWPASRAKQILRRFDHAMIFLLIAGTYTPFLVQMNGAPRAIALGVVVWMIALGGVVLKLTFPNSWERLAIGLYVALGWSGLLAFDLIVSMLPSSTVFLLCVGGVLYTVGVVFHTWRSLRFQNAIWHAFVLAACVLHYCAVLDCWVLTRA
ncbi:PAQR family membrane homeostasis protein TrhA [Microvirga massiliensis]|uniref:PAQR family membrane homeostasis protein TrhA n=1 Tax=Microvirga massiliensis TaxID=1033741 RepID=UPI0009E5EC57|nr:hemolysin III family protein [Microvirga massiliensis]